jgi:hypothetical protein
VSLLKRWLFGTHAGAAKPKQRQAYLDEFAFRCNRRKTIGVGRIATPSNNMPPPRRSPRGALSRKRHSRRSA